MYPLFISDYNEHLDGLLATLICCCERHFCSLKHLNIKFVNASFWGFTHSSIDLVLFGQFFLLRKIYLQFDLQYIISGQHAEMLSAYKIFQFIS